MRKLSFSLVACCAVGLLGTALAGEAQAGSLGQGVSWPTKLTAHHQPSTHHAQAGTESEQGKQGEHAHKGHAAPPAKESVKRRQEKQHGASKHGAPAPSAHPKAAHVPSKPAVEARARHHRQ